MKRILFKSITAMALVLGLQQSASATIHVITVSDNVFTPSSGISFPLGDTIKWTFVAGSMTHTTTSSVIPAGAAAWDHTMSAVADSFIYVPTEVGTYNYFCTPHVSLGMIGSFVVTTPNSIGKIAGLGGFAISPNPARTQVTIKSDAKVMNVSLMDATGRLVRELGQVGNTATEKVFSVQGIAPGMYLLRVAAEGRSATERLVIE